MELLISMLLIFSTSLGKDFSFSPNPADFKTPEKNHRQESKNED